MNMLADAPAQDTVFSCNERHRCSRENTTFSKYHLAVEARSATMLYFGPIR